MVREIKRPPLLVALDTEVFYKSHFNYNSTQFKTLLTFVREGKIRLLITSITVQEVKRHITEKAQLIYQVVNHYEQGLHHKKFQPSPNSQKITIPTNSGLLNKFKKQVTELAPKLDEIKQELHNQFEVFFKEANFEEIKSDGVSVDNVFESYFSGTPPFSEKKKDEFPDAFALLTLQKAAEDKNKTIYVVSGDSDWESFCKSPKSIYLCYFKNIDDLLENINKEIDFNQYNECYDLYYDMKEEIIEKIKNKFPGLNFSLEYDSSIEWGSEKIFVEPNLVDIIKSSLIHIDDSDTNQVLVIFELEVEVNYNAYIGYMGIEEHYYQEDDTYYYVTEPKYTNNQQSCSFYVETTLLLSRDEEDTLCDPVIKDININLSNSSGEIVVDLDCEYDQEY